MSTQKSEVQLQAEIDMLSVNLNNPSITGDPAKLDSLNRQIDALKKQMNGVSSHGSDGIPIDESTTTPRAGKKQKEEKTKKAPRAEKKSSGATGKFKIGDRVKFYSRKFDKEITGEITYIHPSKFTYTCDCGGKYGVAYPKQDTVTAA